MQSKTSMMKVKVKYNKNEERLVNIPQEFIGLQGSCKIMHGKCVGGACWR